MPYIHPLPLNSRSGQDISSDIEAITGQKPTTFRAFSKRELKELL
jgi:hypothetical protein